MYKLEIDNSKIRDLDNKGLICELGYYIGANKEIDDYVKKNIIESVDTNVDGYILFYLFCEFVVDKFYDSKIQDIYDLIDYNYIRLCSMFLNEVCNEK